MHIPANELRIFPQQSPEYVLLHGLRQLSRGRRFSAILRGHPDPLEAFQSAVYLLSERNLQLEPFSSTAKKIRMIVSESISAGHTHIQLHELLSSLGYNESHIRSISVKHKRFSAEVERLMTKTFPNTQNTVYIITARPPRATTDKKRVLIT